MTGPDFRALARAAMAKCCGFDPYFPEKSEVMVAAWAEALEDARITETQDVLMAVRIMYRDLGEPGWRPTPRVLVRYATECRKVRLTREFSRDEKQIEGPPKFTYAEYRERHPDVTFPRPPGKDVR